MSNPTNDPAGRPWSSLLEPDQAAQAQRIARHVAAHLRDPAQVAAVVSVAAGQYSHPRAGGWLPYGLAQGWAGLAVACGYLDACFPDEGWDTASHAYLTQAAEGTAARTQGYAFPASGSYPAGGGQPEYA